MRSPSKIYVEKPLSLRSDLTNQSLRREEIFFDRERARRVFRTLLDAFLSQRKEKIEIETQAAQWKYRPSAILVGSLEHAVWLLSAGSTDVRTSSEDVYHTHKLLWENKRSCLLFGKECRSTRELYSPEVLEWGREDFHSALAKCGFGNPKRNMDWWQTRAKTLWETWEGDPFQMFSLGSVNALMEWKKKQKIDPIPGIGPKIASLIAIFFEEIGMKHIPDAFPVDVHVQRLALALGIVKMSRVAPIRNETLEALLRPEIVRLCDKEGWSRILLSHALWFRGNRGCTNCWKTPYMKTECPVFSDCQGAYQSRPYFKMGLWLPNAGPMAKGGFAPMVPFAKRPLFLHAG